MISVSRNTPSLLLAPMDGVTDFVMREVLTSFLPFNFCVSEFIRVSHQPLSKRAFYNDVPELKSKYRTKSGTPVHVQILGGDPDLLAEAASTAIACGAAGIDINFGCPAPTVNRHDGGATLLKHPERLEAIVRAVRSAVPNELPVSAKLRLGWDNPRAIIENSERVAQGGASWITIHGRTKMQGYTPPAYWKPIGEVNASLDIPVVANGEIWNLDDLKRCQEETGSLNFMLGRGVLAEPSLVTKCAEWLGLDLHHSVRHQFGNNRRIWSDTLTELKRVSISYGDSERRVLSRCKQWLNYAAKFGNVTWWHELKRIESLSEFLVELSSENSNNELVL